MSTGGLSQRPIECPPGYKIREGYTRKGYTRKDGSHVKETYVPARCIKDPSKHKQSGGSDDKSSSKKSSKGPSKTLQKYGYSLDDNQTKRQEAIKKAIAEESNSKAVLDKIIALTSIAPTDEKRSLEISKKVNSDLHFAKDKLDKEKASSKASSKTSSKASSKESSKESSKAPSSKSSKSQKSSSK